MRRVFRRIARTLRATLISPPLVGAGWVAALAIYAGLSAGAVDAEVGDVRRTVAMETFMSRRFPTEILRMRLGVVALALALGLVIGVVALGLHHLRGGRPRLLRSLGLVAALHAALVLWGMADTPQLYAANWYAQGGLRRTIQVFATDWLGPHGVILLTLALATAWVRPARLVALAQRGAGLIRRPLRTLALLSVFFLVDARAADKPEPNKPFNVLILAADSLRSDRIDPRFTPNLTKLAAKGTRFDRAYVSLPRTFPSWVTILSGRHAHHHGVRSMFPTWDDRAHDFDALAGRFSKSGYDTSVISDYAGDIFGRIDLGFARVDTPSFDFRQMIRQKALERETPLLPVLHSHLGRKLFPVMRELSAAADPTLLADDIEGALRGVKNKPFFMTVFFSTAHFPYSAPAPYYNKFTDPKYRGRFKYHKPIGLGRAQEVPPDAEDIRQIQALYDGTVSAVDDGIAHVLRTLDRLNLTERTIVVVTADHGETLFDNNRGQGHGDHLFGDEGTHVPLIIYDPRVKEGHRESRVVRDVDIAPTLYELTGVAPPGDLDGRSLVPSLRGSPLEPRFAYGESELWFTEDIPSLPAELRMPYPGVMGITELDTHHNTEIVLRREMAAPTTMARHRMIRDERYKLVYVPTRLGVKYMLFDTEKDPGEVNDIALAMPQEVNRLKTELWTWMLKDRRMEQRDGYLVPREAK